MPNNKKIFIVDDDDGILDGFRMILENAGYNVHTSQNPEPLLNLASDLPDLIILDILLSGEDGKEVARKLKAKKATKNIPIILISADLNARKSIKNSGAEDFLSKPFEMEELLKKVAKHLKSQKTNYLSITKL